MKVINEDYSATMKKEKLGQRLDSRNKVYLYEEVVKFLNIQPGDRVYFALNFNDCDAEEVWWITKHSVGSVVDDEYYVEIPVKVRQQMKLEYYDMLYFIFAGGKVYLQHERDALVELHEAFEEWKASRS